MLASKPKGKVACKACNARRVRCDRTNDSPCSNCRLAGEECQPIISKRGKHKRVPGKCQTTPRRSARQLQNEQNNSGAISPGGASPALTARGSRCSKTQIDSARVEGCRSRPSDLRPQDPSFEHGSPNLTKESKDKVTYYGDSFNFEYVLREMGGPPEDNLGGRRWANIDEFLRRNQLGNLRGSLQDEHSQNDRQRLQSLGAFDTFEPDVSDELVRTFFSLNYPVCPIFDRAEFRQKYQTRSLSPLVLQAVYFVALAHCDESLYKSAGFIDRHSATLTCYKRAKVLYDESYESNAISTLQATYLLAHWWGSPTEQKDSWYWIGITVGLAQALGLHQQKTYTALSEEKRRLWKRIWWSLYTHDIFVALILGRTPHVNDEYCSLERLVEGDFAEDDETFNGSNLLAQPSKESQLYLIYLADLSLRTSKCLLHIFGANGGKSTGLKSLEALSNWEASLPAELRYQHLHSSVLLEDGFWVALLHLTYCTGQILLRRNGFSHPERMLVGTAVFDAAVQIVRILEDLLSSAVITLCPLRLLPAVFSALSVHIANMRQSPSNVTDVSKHRARLCMLVLNKLQEYWTPLPRYYRLFGRILSDMGCQIPFEEGPATSRHEEEPPTINSPPNVEAEARSPTFGINSPAEGLFTGHTTQPGFSSPGMPPFPTFLDGFIDENIFPSPENQRFDHPPPV